MSHSVGRAGGGHSSHKGGGKAQGGGGKKSEGSSRGEEGKKSKGKGGGDDDDDDKKSKQLPPGIAKKEGFMPPGLAKKAGRDDDDDDDEGGVAPQAAKPGAAETKPPIGQPQAQQPVQPAAQQQRPQQPEAPNFQGLNQALNGAIGGQAPQLGNPLQGISGFGGGVPQPGGINQGPGTTAAINPNATATISSVLNQPNGGGGNVPFFGGIPPSGNTNIIGSNVLQSLRGGDTAGFISSLAGNIQSSLNNSAGLFFQLTG